MLFPSVIFPQDDHLSESKRLWLTVGLPGDITQIDTQIPRKTQVQFSNIIQCVFFFRGERREYPDLIEPPEHP